ncbi:glycerol-3-phosphate dehydrogenase [Xaviernesmea oryzae]|uniref:Glycerol-3-phosphate dehydrogenase n=1 Tax=Xaviernesmea oryzae TaxID=464029 RepID=A0A1Q9B148_9HYPH|nr:glycerol-3-phosphate dehydrogenase/oxidase [Xaviernesmea oryzae]OLP61678.1 glycerol-3-phosphate dehydrogenase [Xaviernesmea oryzae]SEL03153.1 glycerol-3-phosphate dehydrogenase [Xaviernesmea oryzae]
MSATSQTTPAAGVANDVRDVDVVILGGGVNGAGLFRELCLQGLSCLMVEAKDYGAGTSAAPSRLIHGGIKYIETGELGLVAQSTLERNLLLRNAPHCVEPLATFIPAFSLMKGAFAALRTLFGSTTAPRSRGAVLIKIGLALYDMYGARHRVMPKHRFFWRKAALKEMPDITPRIAAGGLYYDAKISRPERLVYELVADGLAASTEAMALNDTRLVAREGGVLTFENGKGQLFRARPRVVVNAAGPWIDRVNAALGVATKMIGGTKGSHILLDNPVLVKSLKGRMIYFEADDGRICLVFDYLGLAMVGSTDMKANDPDAVRCEDEEIDYFLASLRALLPAIPVSRAQIVYAYSGIRPLPASDASQPGLISRDHSSPTLEPEGDRPFPIVSLVGGKWTTFRGFAEEVADTLLARLGQSRRLSTRMLPIGGGRDFPADAAARQAWIAEQARLTGLGPDRLETLLARYGTTAASIAAAIGPSGEQMLDHVPGYSAQELAWVTAQEQVCHLADLVLRRTTLAIEGRLTRDGLREIADVAGDVLGWEDERLKEEIEGVTRQLTTLNRVRL